MGVCSAMRKQVWKEAQRFYIIKRLLVLVFSDASHAVRTSTRTCTSSSTLLVLYLMVRFFEISDSAPAPLPILYPNFSGDNHLRNRIDRKKSCLFLDASSDNTRNAGGGGAMVDVDEDAALASIIRDGLEVAASWRAAFPVECIRAAVGEHHLNLMRRGRRCGGDGDDDASAGARDIAADFSAADVDDADESTTITAALTSAVREAAPTVLAVKRFLSASGFVAEVEEQGEDEQEEDAEASAAANDAPPASSSSTAEARGAAAGGGDGVTVVEFCGPSRGHITGMLVAALLPPRAVAEVVLVDARWPSKQKKGEKGDEKAARQSTAKQQEELGTGVAASAAATSSSSASLTLPTQHIDGLDAGVASGNETDADVTDRGGGGGGGRWRWRVEISRWKGSTRKVTKNTSHLRSLHRALMTAGRPGLVVCARHACGAEALRALQLYHAPLTPAPPSPLTVCPYESPPIPSTPTGPGAPNAQQRQRQPPRRRRWRRGRRPPAAVMLALTPGAAPDRVEGLKCKLLFRAGPTHTFTARQLYPQRQGRLIVANVFKP